MSGAVKFLLSPALALVGGLNKQKPQQPVQTPVVDQSAALDAANQQAADDLRRRRGAGANELTGGGAEASTPGAKTLLGQ